jgi:hypothetical protein
MRSLSPAPERRTGRARAHRDVPASSAEPRAVTPVWGVPGFGPSVPWDVGYCSMLALDISAFNDPRRGECTQQSLRKSLYAIVIEAFESSSKSSRLSWSMCRHEDRGDGMLVVAPPGAPAVTLVDPLVEQLRAGIRHHNKDANDLAAIRLRMSVHVGQVRFDRNGVCGFAVTHLFRMLDAAVFRRAIADADADFGFVTSEAIYEDVISEGPGLVDPGLYARINIRCKETRARAWMYLPPVANPVLRTVSRPQARKPEQQAAAAEGPRRSARSVAAALGGKLPSLPRPQSSTTYGASSNGTSARARLAAGKAAAMSGWLAAIPGNGSWQPGFLGRLHPGERPQNA